MSDEPEQAVSRAEARAAEMKQFSGLLQGLRQKHGRTQARSAEMVGVGLESYRSWERGRTLPNAVRRREQIIQILSKGPGTAKAAPTPKPAPADLVRADLEKEDREAFEPDTGEEEPRPGSAQASDEESVRDEVLEEPKPEPVPVMQPAAELAQDPEPERPRQIPAPRELDPKETSWL